MTRAGQRLLLGEPHQTGRRQCLWTSRWEGIRVWRSMHCSWSRSCWPAGLAASG